MYHCTLTRVPQTHTYPDSLTCYALSHTQHNPQWGTLERSPSKGRTAHQSLPALPHPPGVSVLPGLEGEYLQFLQEVRRPLEGSLKTKAQFTSCTSVTVTGRDGSRAEPSPLVTSKAGRGRLIPFMLLLSRVLKQSED